MLVGYVPALNWLADQGATREELRERIGEAIMRYLETLADLGQPITQHDPPGPRVPPWERIPEPAAAEVRCPAANVSLVFAPACAVGSGSLVQARAREAPAGRHGAVAT